MSTCASPIQLTTCFICS